MKKLFIIGIAIGLLFSSCERNLPLAQFSVDYNQVQPGEIIQFTNLSNNAFTYHWNFGDGTTSDLEHPNHSYYDEGDYDVTLTITNSEGKRDVVSMRIYVWYTALDILAAEWNPSEVVEFIIPNALVVLYYTLDDWDLDQNAVAWGYTDNEGIVVFPYDAQEQYDLLQPRKYWVYVEATDVAEVGDRYDNIDFYDYYPEDYLQTYRLVEFAINEWTVWADYFPPNKGKKSRLEKYPRNKINTDRDAFIKRRAK